MKQFERPQVKQETSELSASELDEITAGTPIQPEENPSSDELDENALSEVTAGIPNNYEQEHQKAEQLSSDTTTKAIGQKVLGAFRIGKRR